MRPKPPEPRGKVFHRLTARAFVHATESEERVLEAVATVLNAGRETPAERAAFERALTRVPTEGHHGNPITILEANLTRAADVQRFWERVRGHEPIAAALHREAAARLDDDLVLHARFDKQLAAQGQLRLATTDDVVAVQLKVAAFPARRETALRLLEEFLAG